MAPVTSTPITRSASPSPLVTDVALGEVAAQRDDANAKIASLDDKLGRIEAALADPANADKRAELKDLKTRFTRERGVAVKQRDTAQRKLDASFNAMRGTGTAKDAAGTEFARLKAMDAELADAKKAQDAAQSAFAAAVNAYGAAVKKGGFTSPQALAAEAKVTGAEAVAKRADATVRSLEHARAALVKELDSTERKAFTEAKKAGDVSVASVSDFTQLSTASSQQQLQAVGAPVVSVTQDEAVQTAMTQLTKAGANARYRDDRAASIAKTFTAQLKTATVDGQDKMVQAAAKRSDLLPELAEMADKSANAASAVTDLIETSSSYAQTALATEIARGTTSMQSELIKTLDARMKDGGGFEAAYALERGLKAVGKPELAKQVAELSRARMTALTSDFQARREEVAQAKTDLARLISGFGPLMPPEKQQAAVDAFKARHQKEFEGWEASGAKLARASEFIIDNHAWNETAAELLPDALSTRGGQALVVDAVANQNKGLRTFLDGAKDTSKVGKYVQQVAVKAVTQQAANLTRAGKIDEAQAVLEGLKKNGLLGMDPKKADKVITALQGVVAGREEALATFEKELRAAKPSAGVSTALRAFGWAASIASGIHRGLSENDVKSMVKASAEVVGPTGEMAAYAVEMLSKAESAFATNAKMLGKGLGAIGTGLGAALDAISSVRSFAKGETVEGSISAAQAIGGAVLAVDAFGAALSVQVVPVWGQIAGAALVIGGTIGKALWGAHKANVKEEAAEADAKAYLVAAGMHPLMADVLSDIKRADGRNVGMMIQQVAPELGMTSKDLFDRLQKLPKDKLEDFVNTMKDVELDENGKIKTVASGADDVRHHSETRGDVVTYYRPLSLQTVTAWTRQFMKDNGV